MTDLTRVLVDIFLMFASAKLLAEACERLRQPAVVGEVLAGFLLGPYLLGLIPHGPIYEGIAEIGVIFLLFAVGLETKPSDIFAVGPTALAVGVLGILVPFVLGYALLVLLGHASVEALFVGTAMVATSVGITARVLGDLGLLRELESRIILAAAVIDDILGMVLLAIVSGIGRGGLSWLQVGTVVLEAVGFTLFLVTLGTRLVRRFEGWLDALRLRQAPLVCSILICLGLSALSSYIGMAAIIGAFLAGLVLAEVAPRYHLSAQVEPLQAFLAPFFFFVMGSHIEVAAFGSREILGLALGITGLAIVGKLVGCGVAAARLGLRRALVVGVGMVPRGEVGIIVGMLGLRSGAVPESMFGVVIFMTVATTLLAPPVLRWLLRERIATLAGVPYVEAEADAGTPGNGT